MTKHKTEDYKSSAVNYYLTNNVSMDNVCKIFNCSKTSLKRWVDKYEKKKSIKRYSRKALSYKITKEQVKYALTILKQNQQITMTELLKLVKKKYKKFDITPQHLGKVLRDNNKTRKRTRHEHFPITKYKKPVDKKEELNFFYKEVSKYKLNNIISLDETSISPAMIAEYSRCSSGQRCIVKTDDSFFFRKFTLLVAITNSKCIGWILYEKGGMTKERLVEFMNTFIFNKYKKYLIILDNAGSHRNTFVKDAITNSNNNYLYSVPYTPKTNAIENMFNQLKHYLKLNKKVLKFNEIKQEIKKAFTKIKKQHYNNYFLYAYDKNKLVLPKQSTRKKKLKMYKD
ncbi:MAG TPA: IS630 family transposase [Cytophagales bacterium]|nr:IS630 family transposase [Cytophagales bacterium]